jgi:Tfp pilus assembly protein PilO
MRYILLLVLISISIGFFVVYVKPKYDEARDAKEQIINFNKNLDVADKLKTSREELIAKYNSIPKADLDNLKILLPDSVDNIRLIIQVDSLAARNGLSTVRDVNYQLEAAPSLQNPTAQSPEAGGRPYGEFIISFSTTGQYKNFLSFLSDLEENLRLVDVIKVDFTPTSGIQSLAGNMSYKITLKTYWLKQ